MGGTAEENWVNNHLCGGIYDEKGQCEFLLFVQEDNVTYKKKKLKKYNIYCLSEDRCRSLGAASYFTGNSPKFCPKRKERENGKSNIV